MCKKSTSNFPMSYTLNVKLCNSSPCRYTLSNRLTIANYAEDPIVFNTMLPCFENDAVRYMFLVLSRDVKSQYTLQRDLDQLWNECREQQGSLSRKDFNREYYNNSYIFLRTLIFNFAFSGVPTESTRRISPKSHGKIATRKKYNCISRSRVGDDGHSELLTEDLGSSRKSRVVVSSNYTISPGFLSQRLNCLYCNFIVNYNYNEMLPYVTA
ncbi:hypothetical protein M422DRAFT_45858 [Sphaerobolus stellatus SS14]|nr:hypothetical protein M422DRAFT_45858 [Sphaerobolus stellatus SS14]